VRPSDTLAQRVRDLGPAFSQFEELDPVDTVSNVCRPQTPTFPHLDVLVQIPIWSKWQDMNSRHNSTHLVSAQQGSATLVDAVGTVSTSCVSLYHQNTQRAYCRCHFLLSSTTATSQREPVSSICLQMTK
jgi:hypothetical protein